MSQRDDIVRLLRRELPDLRRRYPIASLGLFGSFARNEASGESDIDILVEFARPVSLSQFLALEDEVATLTGRAVDLGPRPALKTFISDHIMRDLVVV